MKVKIEVAFDVEPLELEDGDEMGENDARSAADEAAWQYLSFCTVSGVNTDTDEVEVHVDGFGKCKVRLAEDRT